ncbi:MAG: menaquinone biosynthesis decarboxylase [Phycisphaerae bacterium]|nr:MAG: menaquinone biosynthesis decarboxylase [Planctomycetota bacterium]KAB2942479.1 MAG: menaquinone biosynthesis decarboxylase [Phycisphaerae bacterium]MBE7456609.1 menaquinone biosynthesis decarboxylase [Planctomycetia bacterium]MCK6464011.1 menaquinone biosynthesis decarboxylase [Phycisphaerae bacterium]MCL4718226.1 menaquinone biosynthesis decarboxylase [Phycisphaerae bacterium]
MSYPDLQSFLTDLEARGQLKRVRAEVDPVLEISAIADRVSKSPAAGGETALPPPTDPVQGRCGGHGLLFERVKGSCFPVAINVFGSYERMRLALGVSSFETLADRVQKLVKPEMPTTLIEKMKKLPELAKMAGFGPKVVKRGICQQIVKEGDAANLLDLPLIQCWPHDGRAGYGGKPESATEGTGRYITFAGIYTRDPESGERNVGMYRVQAFAARLAAMHWHLHHDGARHFRKYRKRGERMPLAIVLGGEPVLTYAATCPLPPDVSELLFAGFLNDGGIELVPCRTIPLEVPVNAEFVIEGWVDPVQTLIEGPFGDHTGFYSLADRYPAFHVTAITHRENPVYLTTIVGKPPMEDYYLGKATERVFLPLLRILIPDIVDYDLPMFGAFHNCVFVSIRKEYPMQARKVIHSIWGAGQMMFSKMIVVVDEHVNVHDPNDVLFHVGANVDWRRDTVIADGPCDVLDHATPYYGTGAKIGIDATRKIAGEGVVREWPEELTMSADIEALVARRWGEYGL